MTGYEYTLVLLDASYHRAGTGRFPVFKTPTGTPYPTTFKFAGVMVVISREGTVGEKYGCRGGRRYTNPHFHAKYPSIWCRSAFASARLNTRISWMLPLNTFRETLRDVLPTNADVVPVPVIENPGSFSMSTGVPLTPLVHADIV